MMYIKQTHQYKLISYGWRTSENTACFSIHCHIDLLYRASGSHKYVTIRRYLLDAVFYQGTFLPFSLNPSYCFTISA